MNYLRVSAPPGARATGGSGRLSFVLILTGDAGLQVMQADSCALCMGCGLKGGALVATKHSLHDRASADAPW